jgi:hypothetical protein
MISRPTDVGISGNKIVVGALGADNVASKTGAAYLYDISTILPPGADFNDDGIVDNADLLIWESSYANQGLDFNGDGQVDDADLLLWQQGYTTEILFDESPANLDQQGPVAESQDQLPQRGDAPAISGDTDSPEAEESRDLGDELVATEL